MTKAKELVEESGDLREWQIPKVAAKALFNSMVSYKVDVATIQTAIEVPDEKVAFTSDGDGVKGADVDDEVIPAVVGDDEAL